MLDPKSLHNEYAFIISGYAKLQIKMATSTYAQLLALCGPRNPYPKKLGVIEEGAYADILLVDGNPLMDLNIMTDYDKNFVLIIKDGVIYKYTLNK